MFCVVFGDDSDGGPGSLRGEGRRECEKEKFFVMYDEIKEIKSIKINFFKKNHKITKIKGFLPLIAKDKIFFSKVAEVKITCFTFLHMLLT